MSVRRTALRGASIAIVAVLVATLHDVPTLAAPAKNPAPSPAPIVPVSTVDVRPGGAPARPALPDGTKRPAPVWPAAGAVEVALPSAPASRRFAGEDAGSVRAGALPVWLGRATPTSQKVRVDLLDRRSVAGSPGLTMRLTGAGTVRLTVDYRGFRNAFGADWAGRLRLVRLPECALTTPDRPECAAQPLPSHNDRGPGTVSGTVPATGTLLAVIASASSAGGDYKATSLQPASTWSAGGNSGDFSWTYPMRTPPAVGGPVPSVKVTYSAQSVDGRHPASNNQPSIVGEGFELSSGGFIERRYGGCNDDKTGGNNASLNVGDQCWVTDNAMLSLAGHSGELIFNATEGRWHLRNDDGTRVRREVGAVNGDDNGEHWVVTTTEGTQYWFGKSRLPGWAAPKPETASTWTVPVFGNHTNEPCHAATFANSSCLQAWRWNLDYVVDNHGNTMSLWYGKEGNKYARNMAITSPVDYVRGGWLDHIDYGTNQHTAGADTVFAGNAPARVVFGYGDRCLNNCTVHDGVHWPDTPYDQECTGSPCGNVAPTFWTTRRLSTVTTRVWNGTAHRDVERWTMTHTFPDPGDTNRPGLWLDRLAHSGLAGLPAGQSTDVPAVEFTPIPMNNRVDGIDHSSSMNWLRLARVRTESGSTVSVTYAGSDCTATGPKPDPHANNRRCYPVKWKPEGFSTAVQDWFHKYVVTDVFEADNTGGTPPFGSPRVAYHYTYVGDPAWHFTDEDGMIQPDYKTWSAWRGYGTVGTTVGDPGEQTYTTTRFFRGMHGDKQPNNTTRTVVIDGINDEDWWAGSVREEITYNGPSGAEVSATVKKPWASAPTASRTINNQTITARFTNTEVVSSRTALDGGRPARQTRVTTSFDEFGMPLTVDDEGDLAVPDDQQCTKTVYEPRNLTVWLTALEHREQRFAVSCAAAGNPVNLTNADVISDVKTSYDTHAWGVVADRGDVTLVQRANAWNAGSPSYVSVSGTTYDVHGRSTDTWDALNRHTTTEYVPLTGGPVTATKVTNPALHLVWAYVDPAYGVPVATVDANNKRTELGYDGLGRLTGVWMAGRTTGVDQPNLAYSYLLRQDAPSVVTTSKLLPSGTGLISTYSLLDGMLRERQTQAPSPSGGRVVADTFYDTAGRVVRAYSAYHDNRGPAGTTLVAPTDVTDVPGQNRTIFDGAGRVTDQIFQPFAVEKWRTHVVFGGDRTDMTPPAGATATSSFTDADERVVALWQYQAATPAGAHDTTTYAYDRKGQLATVTDPVGNHWDYTYDMFGRQFTVADPDKGTTTNTYDNAGQLTSTTDARGKKLVFTYDNLGRKTAVYLTAVVGTPRARWIWDTVAKGQLTSSSRNVGSSSYVDEVISFNDLYQPTERKITVPPAETGLNGSYTYRYAYRADGSPDTATLPALGDLPGETTRQHYDATLGLPTWLTTVYGTSEFSYVSETRYNALAQVDRLTLDTGLFSGTGAKAWLAYVRELGTGRLNRIITQRETGTPVLADLNYTFDNAGNITKISDPAVGDHQCFRQDYLRRLTDAWTPTNGNCGPNPFAGALGGPAKYWLSWSYDKTGNRIGQVDHATPLGDVTTTYTFPLPGAVRPHTLSGTSTTDSSGTRTASYTYDQAGNTLTRPTPTAGTQTLTWDVEGNLETSTDSTGTTIYLYDADGNRLVRRDPTGRTLYLPEQELRYTTSGGIKTCTRYYNYNASTIASRTAAGLTWLGGDHQGTQQVTIDAVSQASTVRRQTPFGTSRGAQPAWPNSRGFVGGTVDNTGLIHLGAREYDATIGRFISVDPVVDYQDPQQMHGYSYANNAPVTMSDPDGLAPTICLEECGSADDKVFQQQVRESRAEQRAKEKQRRRDECRRFGECGATYADPVIKPQPPPEDKCQKNFFCRNAKRVGNGVVDFAVKHADVVGAVAGVLVGVGCTALTGGGGAVLCGALGGMVGNLVTAGLKCHGGDQAKCGTDYLIKTALQGAVLGGIGGAGGAVVGGAMKGIFSRVGAKAGAIDAWHHIGTKEAVKKFGWNNAKTFWKGSRSNFKADRSKFALGRVGVWWDTGKMIGKGALTWESAGVGLVGGAWPTKKEDFVQYSFGDTKAIGWAIKGAFH